MRNSVKPLAKSVYNSRIVDKFIAAKDTQTYWTEIQLLPEGKIDVVSCHLHYAFTGPRRLEVSRWWHSAQHGYWPSVESAIKSARNYKRSFHVVDMR